MLKEASLFQQQKSLFHPFRIIRKGNGGALTDPQKETELMAPLIISKQTPTCQTLTLILDCLMLIVDILNVFHSFFIYEVIRAFNIISNMHVPSPFKKVTYESLYAPTQNLE